MPFDNFHVDIGTQKTEGAEANLVNGPQHNSNATTKMSRLKNPSVL